MKCECCNKKEAKIKDFRTDEETDITSSYRVCQICFNLNDFYFFKEMRKQMKVMKNKEVLKKLK